MGASRPEARSQRRLRVLASAALLIPLHALGSGLGAQAVATPVLTGTVFVGDTVMSEATVVLHHLTDGGQGELDSLSVGRDGTFSFVLPNVPDPARSDVFFASISHHGVLYFGPAITTVVQLDSVYEIHAYDTLLAPSEGALLALESRSVFFEPDSVGWRVTDLYQLRNDEPRTIVARPGGRVWSHPLPAEARNVTAGEGELSFDAAQFENGELVVRAAVSPGERLFVARYHVDTPVLDLPNRGPVGTLDVLVREPAPAVDVEGLELVDRIELEAGSTYVRFSGVDVSAPAISIVATDERTSPRVEWVAVILALVLAAGGLMILRPGGHATEPVPVPDRRSLLVEIARLDDAFEAGEATLAARKEYERRRAELIRATRNAS